MQISIKNAYANNLKNISVNIPIGEITAFTGVSGSGKSTLLKNILAAYGAKNYTRISSKTVRDALRIQDNVEVDEINNLPNTILIDVKSSVASSVSTVSTISGIHELLRNLFTEYGEIHCGCCGRQVYRDYSKIHELVVDLRVDDNFKEALDFIRNYGLIKSVDYFDRNGNPTDSEKKKALSTVHFEFNDINENLIKDFNKGFGCSIHVISENAGREYDYLKEIECPFCHTVGPNLLRTRFSYSSSFDDGGGACRYCNGTGRITKIKPDLIFFDKSKGVLSGASPFITERGIKYSTVTEKFIEAVFARMGRDIDTPVESLTADNLDILINGLDEEIPFLDRTGGRKKMSFEGIAAYLDSAYRAHKGGRDLANLFDDSNCSECEGSRFDCGVRNFVFGGKTIDTLMNMTLSELGDWCRSIKESAPEKTHKYLDRIIKETDNFCLLSCGHLALSRSSCTLSGGELQRIRVCALLNADIHGLCYLLDEPSSGLHYSDIDKLAVLLKRICSQGNTIVMVEHSKKMLSYCDHIIDLGPAGGEQGGTVLFDAPINDIGNYDTATTRILLQGEVEKKKTSLEELKDIKYLQFTNLSYNNLKNVSVKMPIDSFTVVCGISGSGKSTFVREAVLASVSQNPQAYGFDEVNYLGQSSKISTSQSTVSSLLKMNEYIAKLYEKASGGKLKKNNFMLGSNDGKCQCCGGKGNLYSENGEILGICDQCGGQGFTDEVLKVFVDGINIHAFYNTNLEDLAKKIKDPKIKEVADYSSRLGVGYLTFSRLTKTLSKGELQRVSLVQVLMGKEKNRLLILDEPSKGLHVSDSEALVSVLHEIVENSNTILAVEHNPEMIRNADYVIEFGGTGVSGGYVLFQGMPKDISGTPTAEMLKDFKVSGAECVSHMNQEIRIAENETALTYQPHALYTDYTHAEALIKAARRSKNDFLSVAILNNSMYSRLDRNIIDSDTPIMELVDFKEKLKYDISISEALGIRNYLSTASALENEGNIAGYVFDSASSTGKCLTCSGKGKVAVVNEDFFLQSGDLNAICKKFLKNSTSYPVVAKLVKKDGKDISKRVDLMTPEERSILFWGTDTVYEVNGKTTRWEGVIPNFLSYHKYYSDRNSEAVFNNRKECTCPKCNGERLKTKYIDYKCHEMSYGEWMSSPVDCIYEKIKKSEDENIRKISERLKLLCALGLEKVLISNELKDLEAINAEKIKLISLYFNRVYDFGLVVNNLNMIKEKDIVIKLLKNLSVQNTVWIVG